MDTLIPTDDRALYEADEHAWITRQIDALRSGRLHQLDRDTLVEYLTEMTVRDRRELESRFVVLLQHLLKMHMQPERMSRSWVLTLLHQQREISVLLKSVPSLALHQGALFAAAYEPAVRLAAAETGIPASEFPLQSPWTMDAALTFAPPQPGPPKRWRRARQRNAIR